MSTTTADTAAVAMLLALTVVAPATAVVAGAPGLAGDATEDTPAAEALPTETAANDTDDVEADPSSDGTPVGDGDDGGDDSGDPAAGGTDGGGTETGGEAEQGDEGQADEPEREEPPAENEGGTTDEERDGGDAEPRETEEADTGQEAAEDATDGAGEPTETAEEPDEETAGEPEESADDGEGTTGTTDGADEATEGTEETTDDAEESTGAPEEQVEESVDAAGGATDGAGETTEESRADTEVPTEPPSPDDADPVPEPETTGRDSDETGTDGGNQAGPPTETTEIAPTVPDTGTPDPTGSSSTSTDSTEAEAPAETSTGPTTGTPATAEDGWGPSADVTAADGAPAVQTGAATSAGLEAVGASGDDEDEEPGGEGASPTETVGETATWLGDVTDDATPVDGPTVEETVEATPATDEMTEEAGTRTVDTVTDAVGGAVDSTDETVGEGVDSTGSSVNRTVDSTGDAVDGVTGETTDGVDTVLQDGTDTVDGATSETTDGIDTVFQGGTDTVDDVTDETVDGVEPVLREGTDTVDGVTDETADGVGTVLEDGTDAVGGVTDETADGVGTVLQDGTDTVDGVTSETTDDVEPVLQEGTDAVDGFTALETGRSAQTVESTAEATSDATDADGQVAVDESVEPLTGTLPATDGSAGDSLDRTRIAVDDTASQGWSPARSGDPLGAEVPSTNDRTGIEPGARFGDAVDGTGVVPADPVDGPDGTAGGTTATDGPTVVTPPPGAGVQATRQPDAGEYAGAGPGRLPEGRPGDQSAGHAGTAGPLLEPSYRAAGAAVRSAGTTALGGESPVPVGPAAAVTLGAVAASAAFVRIGGTVPEVLLTAPGSLRLQARTAARSVGGWLRRPTRWLPIPGYSRYDDSDPLENEQRARLYEAVAAAPGENIATLVDRTSVSRSSARYHLRILEHEGLVTPVKIWGKRRFFPAGTDEVELRAALLDESMRTVLETLGRHEPASGATLTEALDRDPSTVSHHLQRLSERGLVVRERDGRAVVNRLTPAAREALGPSVGGRSGSDVASSTD